jgi:outer membrane biogenesis lipoprotein LolB
MLLVITLLAVIALISKLKNIYKCLLLGLVCMFLFSCSKSVSVSNNTISAKTEYRLKQVDLDGHFTYSEIKFSN